MPWVLALSIASLAMLCGSAVAQPSQVCLALAAQLTAQAALNLNDINIATDSRKKCAMHRDEQARLQAVREALRRQRPECTKTAADVDKLAAEQKELMDEACQR
ncbi:MAG: hypothetical protein R3D27_08265 [Hyphomicrobiaceae bacterium]